MTETSDKQMKCDANVCAEINQLKKSLAENSQQLIAMEAACLQESNRHVELEDSLIAWQDKYERLHESHKRVQKTNQGLEDKLLKLVDRSANERAQLTSDVATLSVRLAQANYNIGTLQREIERYKTDMGLAIQLLQCKPENFVSQKVTSLPQDIQTKISQYVRLDTHSHSDSEGSTSGVGIATESSYHILPASDSPTPQPYAYGNGSSKMNETNVHAHNNNSDSKTISPLGMAKYLEDKLKAANVKHCDTCSCASRDLRVLADIDQTYSVGVQTNLPDETNHLVCLRCNTNLNSPSSSSSPFMLNVIKSSDSIISETKSSSISANELTVNPILRHNTVICDRTKLGTMQKSTTAEQIRNNINEAIAQQTSPQPKLQQQQPAEQQHQHRKIDESPKILNRVQPATGISGSSMSSSSRTSFSTNTNQDGSKIFESFNRNLIKSIKAEKPFVSGPRLCALRIPTGSSNIMLDNIESESKPVIYTRPNRFLDEEFDERKDIVATQSHKYQANVSEVSSVERRPQKISMLMSDGVRNTHNSIEHETKTRLDVSNGIDRQITYSRDDVASVSGTRKMAGIDDIQHHDESTILRQQQLSRVAEWVQNNSTLEEHHHFGDSVDALLISSSSNYKVNIARVNNNEISNCTLDRDMKLTASVSQSNNNIDNNNLLLNANQMLFDQSAMGGDADRIDFAQSTETASIVNNNICTTDDQLLAVGNAPATAIDLAQMEYNVKQFLLKQDEWSNSDMPSSYASGGRHNGCTTASKSCSNPHRTETNL